MRARCKPPACLLTGAWAARRRLSSAAASASVEADSGAPHKELQFHTEFEQAACDLHLALLEEAHRKHGVYINVPPQLPPAGTPPEVPDVVFSDAQSERLRAIKLAYAPTHGPPPLATTGTRGLADMLADEDAAFVAQKAKQQQKATTDATSGNAKKPPMDAAAAAAAAPSPSSSATGAAKEVKRLPIEPTNRFHCSLCAKSFRIRLSAEHHVAQLHPSSAAPVTVVEGAGPGELVAEAATPAQQAPAATAAHSVAAAKPTEPALLSDAEYKKLVAGNLPTDDEVDALLIAHWDPQGLSRSAAAAAPGSVGASSFVAVADAVVGVADNRRPQSELDLLPTIRATPEGAAPGIKRAPVASANKEVGGKQAPMKELSARYPNPFGESAESKLLALLKDEPLNPFLPLHPVEPEPGSGRVAGSPSLEAAATLRRFKCHVCGSTFRLLDALAEHCESVHGVEMAPETLLATQGVTAIKLNPYVVQKEAPPSGAVGANNEGSASPMQGGSNDGGTAIGGLSPAERGVAPPTPVVEADVSVHLRASSNMVLVGEVVDVQSGYIKSHRVVQYVVKTTTTTPAGTSAVAAASLPQQQVEGAPTASPASTDGGVEGADTPLTGGSDAAPTPATSPSGSDVGAATGVEEDAEYTVVRAYVENMKFVTDGIKLGSWVMVHGSLRMNRHSDSTSRRLHAYPVVQVAAPMGTIAVVEASS